MGCQPFFENWWMTILQELKPQGCSRIDRHGERSVDTHGMSDRAIGARGYQSHAEFWNDMVGVYPSTFLGTRSLKQIPWDEFQDIFYT